MSKREILSFWLRASGLGRAIRSARLWEGLLVAVYHRVGDGASCRLNQDLFSATAEELDAQIGFFKDNFDIVGPQDLARVSRARRGRYLQLTFDDGYRDNYQAAFPVLRAHGVSATFFVTTGYVDAPSLPWWDEIAWMVRGSERPGLPRSCFTREPLVFDGPTRIEAVRRLGSVSSALTPGARRRLLDWLGEATGTGRGDSSVGRDLWMTWDMMREMRAGGMSFGAHTVSHPELSRLSRAEQTAEIRGSLQRLEAELGASSRVFCYPFGHEGSFNDDTRAALRECGVERAYVRHGGFQGLSGWDDYAIKRFSVETYKSRALLEATATVPQLFA